MANPRLMASVMRALGVRLLRVYCRPVGVFARERCRRDVLFRLLTEPEARTAFSDAALGMSEPFVRKAYSRGDVCVAALQADCVLGYAWLSTGRSPHASGLWIEPHGAAAYAYDVFVRPECRGERIAPWLYIALDRFLTQQGRRAMLSAIDWDNEASIRAASRAGAREAGCMALLRVFGMHFAYCSRGARSSGLRLRKARRARQPGAFPGNSPAPLRG